MIFPIIPLIVRRGKKAATVVKVEATIGITTSLTASLVASSPLYPACLKLNIFSDTTIELSTIMPSTVITAARDIVLKVMFVAFINMKHANMVNIIPKLVNIADLKSKNIIKQINIIKNPCMRLEDTIAIRELMVLELSPITDT